MCVGFELCHVLCSRVTFSVWFWVHFSGVIRNQLCWCRWLFPISVGKVHIKTKSFWYSKCFQNIFSYNFHDVNNQSKSWWKWCVKNITLNNWVKKNGKKIPKMFTYFDLLLCVCFPWLKLKYKTLYDVFRKETQCYVNIINNAMLT